MHNLRIIGTGIGYAFYTAVMILAVSAGIVAVDQLFSTNTPEVTTHEIA